MNLIDYTEFVGEINIPISGVGTEALITDYITKYQDEILRSLLGYKLAKSFIDGLGEVSTDQKWIDLRDGKEFTFTFDGQEITEKFAGVKEIIAYYVYLQFRSRNESFFSGQNQVKAESENSIHVDFRDVLIPIFNKMVQKYGLYYSIGCFYQKAFKPTETMTHINEYPSAFNFILANYTDYPDWFFTPINYANEYGI